MDPLSSVRGSGVQATRLPLWQPGRRACPRPCLLPRGDPYRPLQARAGGASSELSPGAGPVPTSSVPGPEDDSPSCKFAVHTGHFVWSSLASPTTERDGGYLSRCPFNQRDAHTHTRPPSTSLSHALRPRQISTLSSLIFPRLFFFLFPSPVYYHNLSRSVLVLYARPLATTDTHPFSLL